MTTTNKVAEHSLSKIKHLEFIQNVISRMSTNSMVCKIITALLVSPMACLFIYGTNMAIPPMIILIAYVMMNLDARYLCQETLFRNLYDEVRGKEKTDFAMKPAITSSWVHCLSSWSIKLFYLSLIGFAVLISLGVALDSVLKNLL